MMNYQVELEWRECRNCGAKYRVMPTSAQDLCSRVCDIFGAAACGDRKKPLPVGEKRTVSVTVGTSKTPSGWKPDVIGSTFGDLRIRSFIDHNKGENMQGTKQSTTTADQRGLPVIAKSRGPTKGAGMPLTAKPSLPESDGTKISKIQRELSDDSRMNLLKAASHSNNLLNKSATRLMQLMEESVRDSELERSKSGGSPVENHRISTAIDCANALAQTIQTQVNMVKAMTGLIISADKGE